MGSFNLARSIYGIREAAGGLAHKQPGAAPSTGSGAKVTTTRGWGS